MGRALYATGALRRASFHQCQIAVARSDVTLLGTRLARADNDKTRVIFPT